VHGVERHLRVVGADLYAQVAAADLRLERVPEEGGPALTGPISSPMAILAAASDHVRSRFLRSATELLIMSSAATCRSLCAGVAIPAWCAP